MEGSQIVSGGGSDDLMEGVRVGWYQVISEGDEGVSVGQWERWMAVRWSVLGWAGGAMENGQWKGQVRRWRVSNGQWGGWRDVR